MTLPPTLSDLDRDSEDDRQLGRVSVLVGRQLVDLGLPTGVSVSVLANEIIDIVTAQVAAPPQAAPLDNPEGRWTFARPSGAAIDPGRTLAEAGVFDGDLLVVVEVSAPSPTVHVDTITPPVGTDGHWRRWWRERGAQTRWFALGSVMSAVAALLLPALASGPALSGVPVAAMAALLVGIVGATAAGVAALTSTLSDAAAGLAGVALPLIFAGSMYVVPGVHGLAALPMALGVTALVALVQVLTAGVARPFHVAVIALALLGMPAAVAQLALSPAPRALGAVFATCAVVVIYVAPGMTVVATRLPIPRVPTAGEPLDVIEIQGGTAVEGVNALGAGSRTVPTEEGMLERVARATSYLTGIMAAAAVAAVIGCYLAADVSRGFHWQGVAFGFAVATALCLRGRSHHDLLQAATLISGGLLVALTVIVKTAVGLPAAQTGPVVELVALTALLVVCGLVAPRLDFSPVMRRWAEIGEYLAIALVIPLACWIVGVYAFFRGLRL